MGDGEGLGQGAKWDGAVRVGSAVGGVPAAAVVGEVCGEAAGAVGAAPGLGRFFGYQLVSEVSLTGGIWVLYLRDRGLSLGEIGLAEAVFHLAPVTLELPTGSMADVLGRKWSLAIGSLLVAVAAAVMWAARDLWLVLPAMYLSGASYAFRSGAQQAFLYDALAAGGGADRFGRVFGRLASASYVVVGATTWLGATLAGVGYGWPFGLTIGVGLAGVWLAVGLREPERERSPHRGIGRTIGEAMRIVRGKPRLAALIVFGSTYWTLVTLIEIYAQAVLDEQGLAKSAIGLLIGGSFAVVAAGAWVAHHVTARGSFPAWTVVLTVAVIGGGLGLRSGVLVLAVVTYLVAEFATGLFEPIEAERINRDVDGAQRATIISMQQFLFSLNMVWAFPLVGWIAGRAGWFAAYAIAGSGVAVALGAWLLTGRREAGHGRG